MKVKHNCRNRELLMLKTRTTTWVQPLQSWW